MIEINTRDYTTKQLKDLARGLSHSLARMYVSPECKENENCNPTCKVYATCRDLFNARKYIWKKIKEREALE